MPPRTRGRPRGYRSGLGPSSMNDNVRDPSSLRTRLGSLPYFPPLVWGLCGTVRLSGGLRPAWSGFTFSSPSLPALPRPAVACRVRSLARRSFLAARAVLRASDSWVSFMGTTRSRASSSRTSTSALVSSRSMVFDTFPSSVPIKATEPDNYPARGQVMPQPLSIHLDSRDRGAMHPGTAQPRVADLHAQSPVVRRRIGAPCERDAHHPGLSGGTETRRWASHDGDEGAATPLPTCGCKGWRRPWDPSGISKLHSAGPATGASSGCECNVWIHPERRRDGRHRAERIANLDGELQIPRLAAERTVQGQRARRQLRSGR